MKMTRTRPGSVRMTTTMTMRTGNARGWVCGALLVGSGIYHLLGVRS